VVVKKQNKQAKNIYSILCTTAIMGQKSLFVNFNQLSRYKYFYHYITTVWPIVRKHGLVVCVYDKINFGNNLEYKKNDMSSKLIKDILSQYKIKNIIFSPNIFIKN
jgi:hypothetical protein